MRAALLPVLLAGCVVTEGIPRAPADGPSATAFVSEVTVRPSRLVIRMSDGARCVADRPEGERSGWSGVTSDCGYELPYAVTFARGGVPSRFTIEESFGTTDRDGNPGPRAEVFVTDVDGNRKLFLRPLSPELFAEG